MNLKGILETLLCFGFLSMLLFVCIRSRKLREIYEKTKGEDRARLDELLNGSPELKAKVKPLPAWVVLLAFAGIAIVLYFLAQLAGW